MRYPVNLISFDFKLLYFNKILILNLGKKYLKS